MYGVIELEIVTCLHGLFVHRTSQSPPANMLPDTANIIPDTANIIPDTTNGRGGIVPGSLDRLFTSAVVIGLAIH